MNTIRLLRVTIAGTIAVAMALAGCKDAITDLNPTQTSPGKLSDPQSIPSGLTQSVSATQVDLVADNSSVSGARIDPNLVNGWGVAITPTGIIWISSNGMGLSVVYNDDGTQRRAPVTIPTPQSATGGAPSGVLFNNNTTEFIIPGSNAPARFIFSTEDGTIAAWNGGSSAVIVADRSGFNTVYKGVATGGGDSHHFLCATDFRNAKIDVFDNNFQFVTDGRFQDSGIPAGFAPFGIRNFNGFIVVTYAKQKLPDKKDDQSGPGFGYVDLFSPAGILVRRIASQGTLNSPWGLELSPNGESAQGVLYVGNFGDGMISRFTMTGRFLGLLNDTKGNPVSIDGLWGLSFGRLMSDQNKLFFAAGPNHENDGQFGYLALSSP